MLTAHETKGKDGIVEKTKRYILALSVRAERSVSLRCPVSAHWVMSLFRGVLHEGKPEHRCSRLSIL